MVCLKFAIFFLLLAVELVELCRVFGKKNKTTPEETPKTEGFVKDGFFLRFRHGDPRNRGLMVWGRYWEAEYKETESLLFKTKNINVSHCPHNVIFRIYRIENGELISEFLREDSNIGRDEWADKDIYVFTPGFARSGIHPECAAIAEGWLGVTAEYPNGIPGRIAIVVDWGLLSGVIPARDSRVPVLALTTLFIYNMVIENNRIVALTLAHFLEYIIDFFGANPQNIRLYGHSMGAHIVGNAGRFFNIIRVRRSRQLEMLKSITALDPADPWFKEKEHQNQDEKDPDSDRKHKRSVEEVIASMLSPICVGRGQARFVFVVHTNPWKLGLFQAVGNLDVYVNLRFLAGRNQPYCKINYASKTPKGIINRHGYSHALPLIYHIRSIQKLIPFELYEEYPYFPVEEGDINSYTKEPYSFRTSVQEAGAKGSSKCGPRNPFSSKKLQRPPVNIQTREKWPKYFGHYMEYEDETMKELESIDVKLRSGAYSIKVDWDGQEDQLLSDKEKALLEKILTVGNMEHKDIQLNPYKPVLVE